jgi:hypothetical protein
MPHDRSASFDTQLIAEWQCRFAAPPVQTLNPLQMTRLWASGSPRPLSQPVRGGLRA